MARCWLPLYACALAARGAEVSIESFGAVAGTTSSEAAINNGVALHAALVAAAPGDVVVVPAGKRFDVIPCCTATGLVDVGLRVDGAIAAHDVSSSGYDKWPLDGSAHYRALLKVADATNFTLSGAGAIDGQGHHWWWSFARGELGPKRPVAVEIDGADGVTVEGLAILDSPRFNVFIGAFAERVRVRGLTILADWDAQSKAADAARVAAETLGLSVPVFPFNTDGIDVAGRDVVIEDCVIENWDDVVAVKPADALDDAGNPTPTGCTRDVLVRNLTVYRGAGLSVGSVHPSPTAPCVRDVVFEDVAMYSPTKGPYVKPDLGAADCGAACSALIANVTYRRITMQSASDPVFSDDGAPPGWTEIEARARARALAPAAESTSRRFLREGVAAVAAAATVDASDYRCSARNYFCMAWPLYVGTQQQLEPDGTGSGIWAPTEPRVTVDGLRFEDVKAHGGEWPMSAAVLRCNASNPCVGVRFDDVVIDADYFGTGAKYICDDGGAAVHGTEAGKVEPRAARCLTPEPSFRLRGAAAAAVAR